VTFAAARRCVIATVACIALPAQACAALTSTALRNVDVAPPPGARVPLSATLTDDAGSRRTLGEALGGRPAVLILADYTCRTLCGPIVTIAANALAQSGLKPAADFRLIVIGLDPKDHPEDARAMKHNQIGNDAILGASSFLTGDEDTVRRITSALGYRYAYDSAEDQFAHPAAVFVLAADGRLARALSGLGLDGADVRLALVEAGHGRVGTFADHVRLLCYGFDPAAGTYTLAIRRWLAVAGGFTVIMLAGGLLLLSRRPAAVAHPPGSVPSEPG
jgi:protein SCO1/2